MNIDAKVFMTLWLNGKPVGTRAVVATKYPQLGNGFDFIDMSLDDLLKFNEFIKLMTAEHSIDAR